jgi:hypothetical protein
MAMREETRRNLCGKSSIYREEHLKECATRNSKPQLDVARLRNSD